MRVSRDGLAFFLTEHTGDCPVGGLVHRYVPDVDAWFNEFREKGVAVHEPPDEYLQGLRSMTVHDPDGDRLHICTRLPVWHRQTEEIAPSSKDPEDITRPAASA